MKTKQFVYITNPTEWLREPERHLGISIFDDMDDESTGWIKAGEIELEIDIDKAEIVQRSLEAIDKKEEEIKAQASAALEALKAERSNLMALTHEVEGER